MNHDRCTHARPTVAEDALRAALTTATARPWLKQREWNQRDEEFCEVVDATDGVPLFGPPTVGPSPHHAIRYLRDAEAKADAVVALGNGIDSVLGALDALRAERATVAAMVNAEADCPDLPGALRAALDARGTRERDATRDECIRLLAGMVNAAREMLGKVRPEAVLTFEASIAALESGIALLRKVGKDHAERDRSPRAAPLVVLAR